MASVGACSFVHSLTNSIGHACSSTSANACTARQMLLGGSRLTSVFTDRSNTYVPCSCPDAQYTPACGTPRNKAILQLGTPESLIAARSPQFALLQTQVSCVPVSLGSRLLQVGFAAAVRSGSVRSIRLAHLPASSLSAHACLQHMQVRQFAAAASDGKAAVKVKSRDAGMESSAGSSTAPPDPRDIAFLQQVLQRFQPDADMAEAHRIHDEKRLRFGDLPANKQLMESFKSDRPATGPVYDLPQSLAQAAPEHTLTPKGPWYHWQSWAKHALPLDQQRLYAAMDEYMRSEKHRSAIMRQASFELARLWDWQHQRVAAGMPPDLDPQELSSAAAAMRAHAQAEAEAAAAEALRLHEEELQEQGLAGASGDTYSRTPPNSASGSDRGNTDLAAAAGTHTVPDEVLDAMPPPLSLGGGTESLEAKLAALRNAQRARDGLPALVGSAQALKRYKELVTGEQQALIAALARQARDGILINPATGQASTQTPPIIRELSRRFERRTTDSPRTPEAAALLHAELEQRQEAEAEARALGSKRNPMSPSRTPTLASHATPQLSTSYARPGSLAAKEAPQRMRARQMRGRGPRPAGRGGGQGALEQLAAEVASGSAPATWAACVLLDRASAAAAQQGDVRAAAHAAQAARRVESKLLRGSRDDGYVLHLTQRPPTLLLDLVTDLLSIKHADLLVQREATERIMARMEAIAPSAPSVAHGGIRMEHIDAASIAQIEAHADALFQSDLAQYVSFVEGLAMQGLLGQEELAACLEAASQARTRRAADTLLAAADAADRASTARKASSAAAGASSTVPLIQNTPERRQQLLQVLQGRADASILSAAAELRTRGSSQEAGQAVALWQQASRDAMGPWVSRMKQACKAQLAQLRAQGVSLSAAQEQEMLEWWDTPLSYEDAHAAWTSYCSAAGPAGLSAPSLAQVLLADRDARLMQHGLQQAAQQQASHDGGVQGQQQQLSAARVSEVADVQRRLRRLYAGVASRQGALSGPAGTPAAPWSELQGDNAVLLGDGGWDDPAALSAALGAAQLLTQHLPAAMSAAGGAVGSAASGGVGGQGAVEMLLQQHWARVAATLLQDVSGWQGPKTWDDLYGLMVESYNTAQQHLASGQSPVPSYVSADDHSMLTSLQQQVQQTALPPYLLQGISPALQLLSAPDSMLAQQAAATQERLQAAGQARLPGAGSSRALEAAVAQLDGLQRPGTSDQGSNTGSTSTSSAGGGDKDTAEVLDFNTPEEAAAAAAAGASSSKGGSLTLDLTEALGTSSSSSSINGSPAPASAAPAPAVPAVTGPNSAQWQQGMTALHDMQRAGAVSEGTDRALAEARFSANSAASMPLSSSSSSSSLSAPCSSTVAEAGAGSPYPGARPIVRFTQTVVLHAGSAFEEGGHPLNPRVELRVHASDLAREAGLGRDAVAYLLRLVGKEQWDAAGNKHATNHWYEPLSQDLVLLSERYPEREDNRRWALECLHGLLLEAAARYPAASSLTTASPASPAAEAKALLVNATQSVARAGSSRGVATAGGSSMLLHVLPEELVMRQEGL